MLILGVVYMDGLNFYVSFICHMSLQCHPLPRLWQWVSDMPLEQYFQMWSSKAKVCCKYNKTTPNSVYIWLFVPLRPRTRADSFFWRATMCNLPKVLRRASCLGLVLFRAFRRTEFPMLLLRAGLAAPRCTHVAPESSPRAGSWTCAWTRRAYGRTKYTNRCARMSIYKCMQLSDNK